MNFDELSKLNEMLSSIHKNGDVLSYSIDKNRMINFPRGFLRPLDFHRKYFPYISDNNLKTKIATQMMHRDTLHWLWLKTDIAADARMMVIKSQLINLAAILEGVLKYLKPKKKNKNVYEIINILAQEEIILNPNELKELWKARRSVHLHEIEQQNETEFNDTNYIKWNKALADFIMTLLKEN